MHVFVSALKSSAKCDLVLFQNVKINKVVPKVLHVDVGYIIGMFHVMLIWHMFYVQERDDRVIWFQVDISNVFLNWRFSNESSSDHAYHSELILLRCIVWLSICYNHTSVLLLFFCLAFWHLCLLWSKLCIAQSQLRGKPSNIPVSRIEELHLRFFTPFVFFVFFNAGRLINWDWGGWCFLFRFLSCCFVSLNVLWFPVGCLSLLVQSDCI